MSTRSIHTQNSQPPSWMIRSSFKFFLISLIVFATTCHWCPLSAVAAAESDLVDAKSLAMANRILQKVKDYENPPPSWNMILRVMENSFLAIPDNDSNFYQSSPHEEKARERALHWLAHEDESSANLSDDGYDRGLLQRYALATIYFATGGDDWKECSQKKQSSNNPDSICESDDERYLSPFSHLKWTGINGKNGQVTWLDLSGRGLNSRTFLPLEVTLLSPSLELFWVSENDQLEGSLPNYLHEFQSLVSLSAYKTSVSGTIPESIYTLPKLNSIRLYKSKFEGTISTQIGKLAELKWFWIHENEFTGSVPTEIGQLSKLEGVTLYGNKFTPIENKDDTESHITPIENKDGNISITPMENKDGKSSSSSIIPESLCSLKGKHLKHLWSDCEEGALTPALSEDGGKKAALVVKEGIQACSCCTRCFPRKNGVVAAVN
eukprot:CAMPEP_0201934276 /NCGR_PEP_ID=MMETSP0903-20130614/33277_1 /ASSEMBLY_ACC=CAM_ASM_000552 /TAXON_ID=420261 /ORGANISM="Thalassiosira antarctica, Strain CCMP982" /LENGTH=436 /DNA_ID=CAMNT_0048474449 /DNA_START=37 /DNA_END=1347 /DNA_ORIENTATION=+